MPEEVLSPPVAGIDPDELAEWFESLDDLVHRAGPEQVGQLLAALHARAERHDGEVHERLMLPLSLSYDHRVINGADAARFTVRLSAELSDCFQLLVRS